MGQKVNPVGIRLGITRDWNSKWFANTRSFPEYVHQDFLVREFLKRKLAEASVSRINIERAARKANITIHTARPGVVIGKKGEDIERLRGEVARMLGMPVTDVRLPGTHNLANCLAALALAEAAGLPLASAREVFASFGGLPHRSELVHEHAGVRWINDSKGTNPGATVAALTGLVPDPAASKAVLIAGGDGKGADFGMLADVVRERVRALVLIGRDAPRLEQVLAGLAPIEHAGDMEEAVRAAAGLAWRGDCVVLSPACASFDMFDNYEHRGRVFAACVEALEE